MKSDRDSKINESSGNGVKLKSGHNRLDEEVYCSCVSDQGGVFYAGGPELVNSG